MTTRYRVLCVTIVMNIIGVFFVCVHITSIQVCIIQKNSAPLTQPLPTIHEPSQTVYPNRFCQVLDRLKTDAAEEVSFTHDLNAAVRKLRYLHTLQASAGAVG